ncbi:MAG: gluconate 2-dehydrogenase subunit 3 family protein [Solibacteraceae bacterium]|nr:gluconate 2-dehydrogenase subunit 3 family protein [Solibacteraceae bacterium]
MKRRSFFLVASGALAGTGCGQRRAAPFRMLSAAEAATLEAWCDALIPGEDGTLGARGADVPLYRYSTDATVQKFRPQYQQALAAIEKEAGGQFTRMNLEERTTLLEKIEKGEGDKAWWGPDGGREVFNLILQHTLQGYYGNPRHGGNHDYVSWRMLGIPVVPVRGRGVAYGA